MKLDNFCLFSGGAMGADYAFSFYGKKFGVGQQFHFRPNGNEKLNKQYTDIGITPTILNDIQMKECYDFMHLCMDGKKVKNIKRSFGKDLCARNYYQVKNAMAVYAVAELAPDFKSIRGGTRYAVEYAKYLNKLIYVFDWYYENWYVWVDNENGFSVFEGTPTLYKNFAGIGSRKIQKYQIKDKNSGEWVDNPDYIGDDRKNISLSAIKELYENALITSK